MCLYVHIYGIDLENTGFPEASSFTSMTYGFQSD